MSGGLTRRTIVASDLLALVVAAPSPFSCARSSTNGGPRTARPVLEAITTATSLEGLVLDLETGQRGFLVTRQEHFLQPWHAARQLDPRRGRLAHRHHARR